MLVAVLYPIFECNSKFHNSQFLYHDINSGSLWFCFGVLRVCFPAGAGRGRVNGLGQ